MHPRASALVAIAALALFAIDAGLVVGGATGALDLSLERWIQAVPWGPLGAVMTGLDWVGGGRQWIAGGLAVLAAALLTRDVRATLAMAASGAAGSIAGALLKVAVGRPRPDAALVHVLEHPGGASFPSGHAFFYTWLAASVLVLFAPRLAGGARIAAWVAGVLLAVAGATARVRAGVHWPSDVVGGALLAIAAVTAAAAAFTRR